MQKESGWLDFLKRDQEPESPYWGQNRGAQEQGIVAEVVGVRDLVNKQSRESFKLLDLLVLAPAEARGKDVRTYAPSTSPIQAGDRIHVSGGNIKHVGEHGEHTLIVGDEKRIETLRKGPDRSMSEMEPKAIPVSIRDRRRKAQIEQVNLIANSLVNDRKRLSKALDTMLQVQQQAENIYKNKGEAPNFLDANDLGIATTVFQGLQRLLSSISQKYRRKKRVDFPRAQQAALCNKAIKTAVKLDAIGAHADADEFTRFAAVATTYEDLMQDNRFSKEELETINKQFSGIHNAVQRAASRLRAAASKLSEILESPPEKMQIDTKSIQQTIAALQAASNLSEQIAKATTEMKAKAQGLAEDPSATVGVDTLYWGTEEDEQAGMPQGDEGREPPPEEPTGQQMMQYLGSEISDWTAAPLREQELIGKAQHTSGKIGNRVEKIIDQAKSVLNWLNQSYDRITEYARENDIPLNTNASKDTSDTAAAPAPPASDTSGAAETPEADNESTADLEMSPV